MLCLWVWYTILGVEGNDQDGCSSKEEKNFISDDAILAVIIKSFDTLKWGYVIHKAVVKIFKLILLYYILLLLY